MTTPTFQGLLTSQDARDRVEKFYLDPFKGNFWMCDQGYLHRMGDSSQRTSKHPLAIWQGYLQEAAPPPKPRVFKRVEYANVYDDGIMSARHPSRQAADVARRPDYRTRLACVRVEITAIEGQWDD
jgi:hypothetical protein